MGFFSSKKEVPNIKVTDESKNDLSKMPDLPSLPELPPLPSTTIQPLPSLPRSQFGESLGLQAIKSNINSMPAPQIPAPTKDYEIRKIDIGQPVERMTVELPDAPSSSNSGPGFIPSGFQKKTYNNELMAPSVQSQNKDPVFIKLDKFQEAVKRFDEVKSKVKHIEEALKDVSQIKNREEQELKQWEEEVSNIKAKITNIENSLFSRV